MEDEEEVEREKRRRVRGSSSPADPEDDFSVLPRDVPDSDVPVSDSMSATHTTQESSQVLSR